MSGGTGVGSCKGGNTVPMDSDGRAYHLGCKYGEIANEILICSSYQLAEAISTLFEQENLFVRRSNRGYHTYTGMYHGKRLSVIGFGIGFAMVDFLIREVRAVTRGKLTYVFLGSAPSPINLPLGTVVNLKDAVAVEIDFANFEESALPYRIFSKPVPADSELSRFIAEGVELVDGRACSCPSFCNGICAPKKESGGVGPFDFKSEGLLERVTETCGQIASLENDIYILLWTALKSSDASIRIAALSVVGSDLQGNVLPEQDLIQKQKEIASTILDKLGALQGSQ